LPVMFRALTVSFVRLDMSTSSKTPISDTLRQWMREHSRGYAAAAEHFGMSEAEARDICGKRKPRAPAPARESGSNRLERLEIALADVLVDIGIAREAGLGCASLQAIRVRVMLQICDLEEAADLEKKRANLTAGQSEIVDSLIAELLLMPPAIIETVVARLIGRHQPAAEA